MNSIAVLTLITTLRVDELIFDEARSFYVQNVLGHCKAIKVNQKALESYNVKVYAAIDYAIEKFNDYELVCDDAETEALQTALLQKNSK